MPETSPPPTSRRFSPTPVETTVKRVRRFAVEPVETTTRSSKKDDATKTEDVAVERKDFAAKRRFVPEPVETTFKSSRLAGNALPTPEPTPTLIPQSPPPEETPKPRRRFVPELIETTKRSKKAGDSRPATLPTDKVPDSNYFFVIVPELIQFDITDRSNSRRSQYLYTSQAEGQACYPHGASSHPKWYTIPKPKCTNSSFTTSTTRLNAATSKYKTKH